LDILKRINHEENLSQATEAFIENENPIHPATYNRNAEINYLRQLSGRLLRILVSRSNYESKVIIDLMKEVVTCIVLLPLMDIVSDPGTINHLVILATNPKVQKVAVKKPSEKKVTLLENFTKQFEMKIGDDSDDLSGNFLMDQEKLYSFMQHLKSKNSADIELLKFYLDVEHLNAQLDVITDPYKLSELQQKSEKLLTFYQELLYRNENVEKKPKDLLEAHKEARKALDMKWKNDFYKSAEYFQLIYGDKENTYTPDQAKTVVLQQKFSSKLKNVMTVRTGTVEGIEATEIPIWDALDHPLGHSSYYNSVAVKLRKERGQDLDNFMQSFFSSIEQEADIGEDVASTQTKEDENRNRRLPNILGNVELYKNLFNIPGQSKISQYSVDSHINTAVDSATYFLNSILNVHKIILRLAIGVLQFLPDSENIILELIRNFLHRIINESVLATLINDLEEKVFDTKPSIPASNEELLQRQQLAMARIENVNKNLGKTLSHLQNPILNKNLMYCLMDIIIVELFPELNLITKD
jgi:PXA domain